MSQLVVLLAYDELVREFMCNALWVAGYRVHLVSTGEAALEELARTPPDVVVLDGGPPGMDAFAFCQHVRTVSSVPILAMSASRDDEAAVNCLAAGADDYLPRPCSAAMLVARVHALVRRSSLRYGPGSINLRHFTIDPAKAEIRSGSNVVGLTPTELGILVALARRPGQSVDAATLMLEARGTHVARHQARETAKVHVRNLRHKINSSLKDLNSWSIAMVRATC